MGVRPHQSITHRTRSLSDSGVPVGLFSMNNPQDCPFQNARPAGLRPSMRREPASHSAPCTFVARCSAWLIGKAKRSCFRASPLRWGEALGYGLISRLRATASPKGKLGDDTGMGVFAGNSYCFFPYVRGAGGSAPCRVRAEPARNL